MKVQNMTNNNGNKIANQFRIDDHPDIYFQSYDKTIVKIDYSNNGIIQTFLDQKYWNYSNTTGKYRNIFLGETIKDTKAKIKNGTYILTDLNK